MKKFISFIFSVILILPCMLFLTACGETDHTCSFGQTWQTNETKHWKECTISGCTKKSEEANHTYFNSVCSVCGKQYSTSSSTGGSAGGNSGTQNISEVTSIRDLKIYNHRFTDYDVQITYVELPDGKNMVIDATATYVDMDLGVQIELESFLYKLNLVAGSSNAAENTIDYYVMTNAGMNHAAGYFFDNFTIKNLYKPNVQVKKDWIENSDFYETLTDNSFIFDKEQNIQTFDSLSFEDGEEMKYFTTTYCKTITGKGGTQVYDYTLSNRVSTGYVWALIRAAQENGCQIHTINPEQDIYSQFKYNNQIYSYTIDFLVNGNASKVNPYEKYGFETKTEVNATTLQLEEIGQIVLETNSGKYDEYADYASIFSIDYAGISALYLGEASENTLKQFMDYNSEQKTYNLVIHKYFDRYKNLHYIFNENLLPYIFDSTTPNENYVLTLYDSFYDLYDSGNNYFSVDGGFVENSEMFLFVDGTLVGGNTGQYGTRYMNRENWCIARFDDNVLEVQTQTFSISNTGTLTQLAINGFIYS